MTSLAEPPARHAVVHTLVVTGNSLYWIDDHVDRYMRLPRASDPWVARPQAQTLLYQEWLPLRGWWLEERGGDWVLRILAPTSVHGVTTTPVVDVRRALWWDN